MLPPGQVLGWLAKAMPKAKVPWQGLRRQGLHLGPRAHPRTWSTGKAKAKLGLQKSQSALKLNLLFV